MRYKQQVGEVPIEVKQNVGKVPKGGVKRVKCRGVGQNVSAKEKKVQ